MEASKASFFQQLSKYNHCHMQCCMKLRMVAKSLNERFWFRMKKRNVFDLLSCIFLVEQGGGLGPWHGPFPPLDLILKIT